MISITELQSEHLLWRPIYEDIEPHFYAKAPIVNYRSTLTSFLGLKDRGGRTSDHIVFEKEFKSTELLTYEIGFLVALIIFDIRADTGTPVLSIFSLF